MRILKRDKRTEVVMKIEKRHLSYFNLFNPPSFLVTTASGTLRRILSRHTGRHRTWDGGCPQHVRDRDKGWRREVGQSDKSYITTAGRERDGRRDCGGKDKYWHINNELHILHYKTFNN